MLAQLSTGVAAYRGRDLIEFIHGRSPKLANCRVTTECTSDLRLCYCGCMSENCGRKPQEEGERQEFWGTSALAQTQPQDTALTAERSDSTKENLDVNGRGFQHDLASRIEHLKHQGTGQIEWWRDLESKVAAGCEAARVANAREAKGANKGVLWVIEINIGGHRIEALTDSGASRSFLSPRVAEQQGPERRKLTNGLRFQGISGEPFVLWEYVEGVRWSVYDYVSTWDFLVVDTPYRAILGADWLHAEVREWDIEGEILHVGKGERGLQIKCRRQSGDRSDSQKEFYERQRNQEDKTAARQAHRRMLSAVQGLGDSLCCKRCWYF